MADKPGEILLFDFLTELIDAAVPDDPLFQLELHDTIYQKITKENGLRISDAISDPAPERGGIVKEFDIKLQLVCFARVLGTDQKQRADALQKVYDIEMAIIQAFVDDNLSLGGRVCDLKIDSVPRSYDSFDGNPYAIALIPIVLNPTG